MLDESGSQPGLPSGWFVRVLGPADLETYLGHLTRLDGPARALRFSAGVDDPFVLSHCLNRVLRADGLVGGFVDGQMRGAAEIDLDDDRTEGEPALSVEKAYRRKGLGRAMLCLAIERARVSRVGALRFDVARGNLPMIKLVEATGAMPVSDGATRTYRLVLNELAADAPPAKPSLMNRLFARSSRVA
jgi:ribosomal protein S18 acetylase RimI-like enzyme